MSYYDYWKQKEIDGIKAGFATKRQELMEKSMLDGFDGMTPRDRASHTTSDSLKELDAQEQKAIETFVNLVESNSPEATGKFMEYVHQNSGEQLDHPYKK